MTDSLVVTDEAGQTATLLSDPASSGDRISVRLVSGERLDLKTDLLERRENDTYYLPYAFETLRTESGSEHELARIPLAEEQVRVEKRVRETGRVRVAKRVDTRTETIEESLRGEEVDVERVQVERYVDEPSPSRTEGDTTIIPVYEEVLVVEKRLLLKEELHITKRRTERRHTQDISLRSERVEVERLDPDDTPAGASSEPD